MLEEHPAAAWPRLAFAEVLEADGEHERAACSITEALSLEPDDLDFALSAAALLVTLGRLEQAARQLDRVASATSSDADRVRLGRRLGIEGRLRERHGDLAAAERVMRSALEMLPEYEHHWVALGQLLLNQGRTDEAEDVAVRGLRRFPNDRGLRTLLGYVREDQAAPAPRPGSSTAGASRVTWSTSRS